ncbi:MAG: hypothetical protein LKM30_07320 [Bacilli bacterium]|nr:hypothetical protein [Bacilli bacterium]
MMLPIAWFLILKIYKPVPVSKEQIQDFVAHIDVPEKMGRKEIYPLIITAATIDSAENADLVKSSDPVTYVSNFTAETATRMLIEHGDSDTTVTYKNSQYLYDGIKDTFGTTKAALKLMPGMRHMDSGFYTDSNLTDVTGSLKTYFGL